MDNMKEPIFYFTRDNPGLIISTSPSRLHIVNNSIILNMLSNTSIPFFTGIADRLSLADRLTLIRHFVASSI